VARERLLSVVRGYDAVARLGGDEFALLIGVPRSAH
jgi:GGDEF domain-containing protein